MFIQNTKKLALEIRLIYVELISKVVSPPRRTAVRIQNKSRIEFEFHSEFWLLNSCKTRVLQLPQVSDI